MAFIIHSLEKLTNMVHKMHNKTTWNEKLFASKLDHWYLLKDGVGHYTLNSLLYITTVREKYIRTYESLSVSCKCMPM